MGYRSDKKSTWSCDLLRVDSNFKNLKSFEPTLNEPHDHVDLSFTPLVLPPLPPMDGPYSKPPMHCT